MRKVVLYTLMSLDGAVDDPGAYFSPGPNDNQPPEFDPAMDAFEADLTRTQDAVVLGRGMYDEWSAFWPTVADQPFADFINRVRKYVLTSTPLSRDWSNAEAVAGPGEDLVRRLRAEPGGDIGVHGSIRLARSLLKAGLVDELRLVVAPAYGFGGRRLFEDVGDVRRLELVSVSPSPTGSVLLSYRLPPA